MPSNYSTFLAAGSGSAFNPWSFHLLNQTYLTWVGWLLAHIKRTSASYSQAVDETSQDANGFQVEIVSTHRWVDLPEGKQMHCKHPISLGSYRTPKKTSATLLPSSNFTNLSTQFFGTKTVTEVCSTKHVDADLVEKEARLDTIAVCLLSMITFVGHSKSLDEQSQKQLGTGIRSTLP